MPIPTRAEAARRLAAECRDYETWQALCSVATSEDDDVTVRCAAVESLPQWNRYAAVNFLTRRFGSEQVRAAAIATLKRMGPVEGEMEAMLLTDLAALRKGASHIYLANLAGSYGCDPRLLECLHELSHSDDQPIRCQAAGVLCQLGEPALHLAADPSPEVRARLCEALGSYQEQSGAGVLERLLTDPDAKVAKEAKKALRLLGRLEKVKPGPGNHRRAQTPWARLLGEISRQRLADTEVAVEVSDALVTRGWLGEPGATEQEVEEAERRLGIRLPPSYRQFLLEANGFQKLSPFISRLFGTAELDWFRTCNADWIEAYQSDEDISPEEHQQAAPASGVWRTAYLWSCLQISEVGDSAVVLLNPEVVTPAGEWEAWFFANWIPGVQRYPSFWEYMQHEATP